MADLFNNKHTDKFPFMENQEIIEPFQVIISSAFYHNDYSCLFFFKNKIDYQTTFYIERRKERKMKKKEI